MVEQTKAKRVPWTHMEKYLETHRTAIATYLDLKKSNLMDIPEIEAKLPKSFQQLYEVIIKILKDNDILPNKEESKASNVDQSQVIIAKFKSLQNTLVTQNSKHLDNLKHLIKSINSMISGATAKSSENSKFL